MGNAIESPQASGALKPIALEDAFAARASVRPQDTTPPARQTRVTARRAEALRHITMVRLKPDTTDGQP